MSVEQQNVVPLIDGFLGEDRETAEHALSGKVSPEALNVDYGRGTVLSRGGVKRWHGGRLLGGGIRVNSAQVVNGAASIAFMASDTAYDFAGDFTYQLMVTAHWTAVNGRKMVLRRSDGTYTTTPTTGVCLYLADVAGVYTWACAVGHTGGAALEVTGPVAAKGVAVRLGVSYEASTRTVKLWVNGTAYSGVLPGSETFQAGTGLGMTLGDASGSELRTWFVVDELRIYNDYDLGRMSGAAGAALRARELLSSEITAALLGYWKFNEDQASVWGGGPGMQYPDLGSENRVCSAYAGCYAGRGMVHGLTNAGRVTGLQGVLRERPMVEMLVGTPSDAYVLDLTSGGMTHLYALESAAPARWSGAHFDGWTLFVNGAGQNLRYRSDTGARLLSVQAPTNEATVAAAVSAGGSVNDGVHGYLFTWRDSVTGAESSVGLFTLDATTGAGNNTVTLSDLPTTDQIGVDQLRIYRTKAGGSVYYLLATKTPGTASHVDTAADSTLVTVLNEYTGHAGPSVYVLEHDERVWCLGQTGYETRALYSERGSAGAFYRNNYVYAGRNDGDRLVAGASLGSVLVLFKERSIWTVTGPPFAARRLVDGEGCVAGATVATSPMGVFYLGAGGVMLLGAGGAPENLSWATHGRFFASIEEADYPYCAGAWDPEGQRYFISVRVDGAQVTMVYESRTKAWSKWDLEAEAWCVGYPDGGAHTLFCGWRGYVSSLSDGLAEGVTLEGESLALGGTATGGTTTTIEDTGAAWPVGALAGLDVTVGGVTRRVWWNDEETLYVTVAFGAAVTAGAPYALGGMTAHWRSPRMLLNGDVGGEKSLGRVRAIFGAVDDADPAAVLRWKMEDAAEQTAAVDAGVRIADEDVDLEGLGREGYVGVRLVTGGKRLEVEAIGVTFEERVGYPGG